MAAGEPVHIAIVDDEPDLRMFARLLIATALGVDHRITEVEGGRSALELCAREQVDVLVLDLHMPDVNGLEVIGSLKDAAETPCIVAWSADDLALAGAARLGAQHIAFKGTDGGNLTEAIRDCLHAA
jgi:CheY-like chemotaxis protein